MKNSGWIKHFLDGKVEYGYDHLVNTKKASWSKGRLDGICAVELIVQDKSICSIVGTGQYHQSDDYEVGMISDRYQLVTRRIQKKIETLDGFVTQNGGNVHFAFAANVYKDGEIAQITKDMIGKWLTIEYDHIKNNINITLQENRI